MRIDRINIYKVLLPFSGEFSHSIRKRLYSNNIVVELICRNGEIVSYGEGAPRSYVTGETQESAITSIKELVAKDLFPWDLHNILQIWDFIDSLPDERGNNAAICCIEMALLEALAEKENKGILDYFPGDFYSDTIYYGAAIPLSSRERIIEVCRLIKKMAINKLKLKLGEDPGQNKIAFNIVSGIFNEDYDLKVDINGAWNLKLALDHLPVLLENNVKIVGTAYGAR